MFQIKNTKLKVNLPIFTSFSCEPHYLGDSQSRKENPELKEKSSPTKKRKNDQLERFLKE
jgi:hypothetical protein